MVVQFERLFGTTVKSIGDGEAAALADAGDDCGRAYISLHFGTGVGGAIVTDKKVVRLGPLNSELGHIIADPAGPHCTCGKRGCLQAEWQNFARGEQSLAEFLRKLALIISNLAQIFPACQVTLGGRLLDAAHDVVERVRSEIYTPLEHSAWIPAIRRSRFGIDAPLTGALKEAVRLGEHRD